LLIVVYENTAFMIKTELETPLNSKHLKLLYFDRNILNIFQSIMRFFSQFHLTRFFIKEVSYKCLMICMLTLNYNKGFL